jgi:hypothetical protein
MWEWLTAGVTGRQWMLTLLRHLIPLPVYSWVHVSPVLSLWSVFSTGFARLITVRYTTHLTWRMTFFRITMFSTVFLFSILVDVNTSLTLPFLLSLSIQLYYPLLSLQNNTVNFIGQGLVTWREIIRDVSLTWGWQQCCLPLQGSWRSERGVSNTRAAFKL